MIVFKILLIILVAAPVIGISLFFYSQMVAFIRERNRREKAEIERERFEKRARKRSAADMKREAAAEKKAARGKRRGTSKKRKTEGNGEQE